jgi:hypothetical protein
MKMLVKLFLFVQLVQVFAEIPTAPDGFNKIVFKENQFYAYWKPNGDKITFEMQGKTLGWIGINFSEGGGMSQADTVVGSINGGDVVLRDQYSSSYRSPSDDKSQDLEFISASEEGDWTTIRFDKPKKTEDSKDHDLSKGSVKVCFAHGRDNEDINVNGYWFMKHRYSNRGGCQSVEFKDEDKVEATKATTVKPTTIKPTTVKPTTVKPTTVKPTTVKPTTVRPPVTRVAPKVDCKDKWKGNCTRYTKYCKRQRYISFMKRNCGATCGYC